MNKEELETNKAALELLISENGDKCIDYKAQVAQIERDLKDLGKIALPPVVFDDIYEAVEEGVTEFDWTDTDNFDKEFNIDYDMRRLIYDMYYADEISVEIAERLLDRLEKARNKRKGY